MQVNKNVVVKCQEEKGFFCQVNWTEKYADDLSINMWMLLIETLLCYFSS